MKKSQKEFDGGGLRFAEEEEETWTQSDQVSIVILKETNTK